MAAANSKGRILAGSFGKRFVDQIRGSATRDPAPLAAQAAAPCSRKRGVHKSAYDKNVDEQVRPTVVPDDVIDLKSDYWEPNPKTGVFGPGGAQITGGDDKVAEGGSTPSSTMLDQVAWFRPLEDVEKPRHD